MTMIRDANKNGIIEDGETTATQQHFRTALFFQHHGAQHFWADAIFFLVCKSACTIALCIPAVAEGFRLSRVVVECACARNDKRERMPKASAQDASRVADFLSNAGSAGKQCLRPGLCRSGLSDTSLLAEHTSSCWRSSRSWCHCWSCARSCRPTSCSLLIMSGRGMHSPRASPMMLT